MATVLGLTAALVPIGAAQAQESSETAVDAPGAYYLPASEGTSLAVTQGNRSGLSHRGDEKHAFDFALAEGLDERFPVVAARGGTVLGVRTSIEEGGCALPADTKPVPGCWRAVNYVLIDHGDGTSGLYMHLAQGEPSVEKGQVVSVGTPLGTAGMSGWTTDTGLHFQVQPTPTYDSIGTKGWFRTGSLAIGFSDPSVIEQRPDGLPIDGDIVVSGNPGSDRAPFTPISRPAEVPVRLPWPAGEAHSISSAYDPDSADGYGFEAVFGPDGAETLPVAIHPLFGGDLVYAGCATGRSSSLGRMVIIRRVVGDHHYDAIHGHLHSVAPELAGSIGPISVGSNDAIGIVSPTGDASQTASDSCAGDTGGAARLYAGIVMDATVSPAGEIIGGTPVQPEPLVGRGAYEGLAWWSGPMTARDLTDETGQPSGRWANRAVKDGERVRFGDEVDLVVRVRDPADIREVRFTAYYPDWPRSRSAARLTGFDPSRDWRVLAICRPKGVGGDPRKTRGCRWEGDAHDARITYRWDPTEVVRRPATPWSPRARTALRLDTDGCVPVSLSFEVIDASGYRRVPSDGLGTTSSCTRGEDAERGSERLIYLNTLKAPRAPGQLTVTARSDSLGIADGEITTMEEGFIYEVSWSDRSDNEAGFLVYRIPVRYDCQGRTPVLRKGRPVLVDEVPAGATRSQGRFAATKRTNRGGRTSGEIQWIAVAAFNQKGESRTLAKVDYATSEFSRSSLCDRA